jgi:hypothetical protein
MRSPIASLVARDFLALRRERSAALGGLLVIVLWPLLASAPGIATFVMTVFMLSLYGINVFSIEEKYHTERFIASLAVQRREIVLARYAGTLVVGAVYFTLAFFYNALNMVLGNHLVHPITLGYCAMLMASFAAVTAISFPFYFGLGIMKARLVTIVLYFLPLTVGSLMVTLDKGTGSRPPLYVLTGPSPALFSIDPLTSVVVAGAALLLCLASIPVAVRLYETRDL